MSRPIHGRSGIAPKVNEQLAGMVMEAAARVGRGLRRLVWETKNGIVTEIVGIEPGMTPVGTRVAEPVGSPMSSSHGQHERDAEWSLVWHQPR